jgi:Carboxypeptidase regulatory-like domain
MRMMRFCCCCSILVLSFLAAACILGGVCVPAIHAQGIITGGIAGTVTDQTGAVIPNANVKATSEGTGAIFQATANGEGAFNIPAVPIGVYTVTITANGFSSQTLKDVHVVAGNPTPLKAALSLGKEAQTIEVEGSASELINTESPQVETTISTEQLSTAPVAGSMDNLALASPGVVWTRSVANSNTNGVNYSVNGQRGRSNNSEIDGETNNDTSIGGPSFFLANQDAIQEVQVVTTDMGAQYGRNMGAITNYITKSGTNTFHGTGFDIYTGSWLSSLTQGQKAPQYGWCPQGQNANCLNNQSSPDYGDPIPVVPRFVQNNYGGTLGGPIWRNKIWGFGSTLWDKTYESGVTLTSGGGLFPDATGTATLNAAFPNNPAVAAMAANGPFSSKAGNPAVVSATSLCAADGLTASGSGCLEPVTNGTTTANVEVAQYSRTFPSAISDQEDLGRIDWDLTPKDRIYLRYNYQNNPYAPAFYLTTPAQAAGGAYPNVYGITYETGGDWTHTFTPAITNQLRYAFQQSSIGFYGGGIPSCTISSQATCSSAITMGAPFATYGYDLGGFFPQGRFVKVNQFQDNASITKGRHTMLFGGEFDYQDSPWGWLPNDEGAFNFGVNAGVNAANPSGIPYNLGTCGASCSNGLTGFLEGIGELTLAEGNPTIPFKENDFDLYFQDYFKITQNLTLNLGLRYEFFGQAIDYLHNETVARQKGSKPFWDTALPLSATTVPSIPNFYRNIEPRIGFSYMPTFAPKMVVHGGFSINADPEFYSIFVDLGTSAPAVNSGSFACDGVTVKCVPGGGLTYATVQAADDQYLPSGGDPRTNPIQTVTSNFHNPQGETYSLGIQYQVAPAAVADVRYVGNHTYGNFQAVNANPDIGDVQAVFPSYGQGISLCSTPVNSVTGNPNPGYPNRPNCAYGALETYGNGAFSIYDALQTSLTMRNFHGFSGIVSYAWSRTISNTSDFAEGLAANGVGGGQASPFAQDPLNTDIGERGVDANSYPNVFGAELTYNTPWYHDQRGILGRALGGYMINVLYSGEAGQPYNPLQTSPTVASPCVAADITDTPPTPPSSCIYTPAPASINVTEASQGFADQGFAAGFSASGRPVLSNPNAPLNSVGINLGPGGYVDYVTGGPVARSSEHWIWSNEYEAIALHNPFPGVGRNILRGDSSQEVDASAGKTFKVAERVSAQLVMTVFNVLNRGYYQNPNLSVESLSNFESQAFTGFSISGNEYGSYPVGLGNRNVQFTGKIIF